MTEKQHIHQNISLRVLWYRLADACCIVVGLLVSLQYGMIASVNQNAALAAIAIVIYYLFAEAGALYRSWRGASIHRELAGTLACWSCTLLALLALGFLTDHTAEFSRISMLAWFAVTPGLIIIVRVATRGLQRMLLSLGYNIHTFAIVGVNELGFQLARNIAASPELGLRPAGFFDDRPKERTPIIPAELGSRIGTIDDLVAQAREGKIQRIYITFPMRAENRIRLVLDKLGDTTASVSIVPDFFVFQLLHSRWSDILGLPTVSVFDSPLYGTDGMAKRLCDLVFGGLFLLLAAVPMTAIAAAIKLTSPGPVFFRQRRYGLDGREIRVWKFRTMTVCEDGPAAVQAVCNDPRVTPLGALLRKSSLDELPQLFNVLGGSMSLVGPRPHANAQNEEFRSIIGGYMLRHKVKPGITGLAQINGARGETDSPDKMKKRIEYDHCYIREWSLWMDIRIMIKTVFVVFSGKNAY